MIKIIAQIPSCPKQLVDIAALLVEQQTATLAGAIRINTIFAIPLAY